MRFYVQREAGDDWHNWGRHCYWLLRTGRHLTDRVVCVSRTGNVNPIKLRGYLAAGLSVVSILLPEVRTYARVVRFGETAAEFLTALDESVTARQESSIRACQEAVRKETWLGESGADFRTRASSLTLAELY
jgi:hypothetical protein